MANEKSYNAKDATLIQTKALPASAGSVSTTALDLGSDAVKLINGELEIIAPALTTTQLPDGETAVYKIEDSADNSTFATVADAVITQTGAGGAGAAAVTERFGIPSNIRQYVRVTVTTSSLAGDCSGSSVTFQLVL